MKMEKKMTLTFAIMFVIMVAVNCIQRLVLGEEIFTSLMWFEALFCAFCYLVYIWIETRKHKKLALLAIIVVVALVFLFIYSLEESTIVAETTSGTESGFTILKLIFSLVKLAYFIIAERIADRQVKDLLKEDKMKNMMAKNHRYYDE